MLKKIIILYYASSYFFCFSLDTTQSLFCAISVLEDSYFPCKKTDQHQQVRFLSKDLQALSLVNKTCYKILNKEKAFQSIIVSVASKQRTLSYLCIAQRFAIYISVCRKICDHIRAAFDPEGRIKSSWYANATQDCEVKPTPGRYIRKRMTKSEWREKNMRYYSGEPDGWDGGYLTPLSLAIKSAHKEWVCKLIEKKADINQWYNSAGEIICPLYEVIYLKSMRQKKYKPIYKFLIDLLLQRKAKVNGISSSNKETPLALAIRHEDKHSIRLLLRYGADTTACIDMTGLLAQLIEEVAAEKEKDPF